MDVLIDSIVRQTTVLIAHMATAAGVRAPLAHIANQVFVDLAKVRRLSESSTDAGESLWEATLRHVQEKGTVGRSDVLRRFSADDATAVAAVLRDLVNSGLLFRTGQGDRAVYRAASPEEYRRGNPEEEREGLLTMLLVALNRYAPATPQELAEAVPMDMTVVQSALEQLLADNRVRQVASSGAPRYECVSCVIPLDSSVGWEAAVFDHFQAMVTALCTKLRMGSTSASQKDWVGGSTYGFDVWKGHPHRDEVLSFLGATRQRAVALREKVEAYNAAHVSEEVASERVLFYAGQTVIGAEQEGGER